MNPNSRSRSARQNQEEGAFGHGLAYLWSGAQTLPNR